MGSTILKSIVGGSVSCSSQLVSYSQIALELLTAVAVGIIDFSVH